MKIVTQSLIAILILTITCTSVYVAHRNDSYFKARRSNNVITRNIRKMMEQ